MLGKVEYTAVKQGNGGFNWRVAGVGTELTEILINGVVVIAVPTSREFHQHIEWWSAENVVQGELPFDRGVSVSKVTEVSFQIEGNAVACVFRAIVHNNVHKTLLREVQ